MRKREEEERAGERGGDSKKKALRGLLPVDQNSQ